MTRTSRPACCSASSQRQNATFMPRCPSAFGTYCRSTVPGAAFHASVSAVRDRDPNLSGNADPEWAGCEWLHGFADPHVNTVARVGERAREERGVVADTA